MEIGDTVIFNEKSSKHHKKKGFIFLTFDVNVPNNRLGGASKTLQGTWICSESGEVITLGNGTLDISYSPNLLNRSRILLCEKNMNKQIRQQVSKSFSTNLISYLSMKLNMH